MLSVCVLSGGEPGRLAALLESLRPVAGEVVVAVDDRVDRARLARARELADVLVAYPFAAPVERPFAWLHSLCRGDWIFRIDDDEAPSPALLAYLARPEDDLTHAWFPRRWLWQDGWLDDPPWAPDWQLRLVRRGAATFPGRMHVPIEAGGPHAYVQAPIYHLDLVLNERARREAKAAAYERLRPGIRVGGLPLNAGLYLPELRASVRVAPLSADDEQPVARIRTAAAARPGTPPPLRTAERDEIDALWADAPLAPGDYAAAIEVGRPPSPVAGEVREIDVIVTNGGGATWPGIRDIRLSYWWRGVAAEQLRTRLPRDLAPGDAALVPLTFRAPDAAGTYTLAVDLVHERHRWFGAEAETTVEVRARRRAVVLVGQPPGDKSFDARVDALLARLDPALEPLLVGEKPDWLRDRFGVESQPEPPARADAVYVLPAGRRRERIRLRLAARRLRRSARG